MAGRCVLNVLTVWKTSTTPSYCMRSRTQLKVMNTPVRPTPALKEKCLLLFNIMKYISRKHNNSTNCSFIYRLRFRCSYLQWTVIGPSCPNCSFVLCTWPIKSMNPSPDLGTPCSGQSVNWNCLIVLDWPSRASVTLNSLNRYWGILYSASGSTTKHWYRADRSLGQ